MKSANKVLLTAAAVSLAFALHVNAQVQTTTTTTTGKAAKEVQVERGEVVTVAGNDLVVKMEDGTIRHFPNIPESARITVDGKQLGIHDLKPGMKLQRTITTTTSPQTVTTVQTVTGKVWYVSPPNSVILTMENGQNQSFKIPKGQKFDIDGQMVDAFGLKKGMNVKATKIVEVPDTLVATKKSVTGTMPTPPQAPPADAPILIATKEPTAGAPTTETAQATPAAASAKLPKTGSELPLVGILGLAFISASLAIKFARVKLGF